MSNIIMLMPMDEQVSLDVIATGMAQAIEQCGLKVKIYAPFNFEHSNATRSIANQSMTESEVVNFLSNNQAPQLLEELVARLTVLRDAIDVILVLGALPTKSYLRQLNVQVAQTYGAWTIPLITNQSATEVGLTEQVSLQLYELQTEQARVSGVVLEGVAADWRVNLPESDIPVIASLSKNSTATQVVDGLCNEWVLNLTKRRRPTLMSPPAFRYRLTELARQANKKIVLPEGEEPRTIKAASLCGNSGIANCVLLGDPVVIKQTAQQLGVTLDKGIEIIDPVSLIDEYVPRLVALRHHKGVTEAIAAKMLQDTVVLGTLMLECGVVDGLVSGAVHTTANTIRPALQLIKTAPGNSLVSSVFFMLLPEQTYVYGDCAINPNPTAEELAEIAIQSADSAASFGIEPRVAMLSYSTLNSGAGSDVDMVRSATELVKKKRPDILVDGPLQYDAAVMPDVAQTKAPGSEVAGRATVFIFPNLNAGNIGYKAVQRSANLVAIGPMLQGLRKPVNDLSRGALVEDIVYTIALTAIQATQITTA